MHKLHEFILTFFYCGKISKIPGTIGSLAAVLFWMLVTSILYMHEFSILFQSAFWGYLVIIFTLYSLESITIYTKAIRVKIDHPTIVVDEVVGQIIALQLSYIYFAKNYFSMPILILHPTLCFVLFRLLDITKPWLIGHIDRTVKNSLGVMLDDIISGLIAGLIVIALTVLIK